MLSPSLLASIQDLEFVARVTVEGALSGLHRSPFHGYSAEFNQYRHYRAGDDLKYVDWKLLARTDRLYTKQFRETTNMRVQIAMDASRSMAFGGRGAPTKLEYARVLAAALSHLVVGQGDAAGLALFGGRLSTYVGARPGRAHLRHLLTKLSHVEAEGRTDPAPALRKAVDLLKSRGALIVLSDCYEDEELVDGELRRAVRIGHDASVFHVLSREELDGPWAGESEVEDIETGERVLTSRGAREEYAARMEAFVRRCRERAVACGAGYVLARTDAAPSQTLRAFLLQRGAR